MYDYTYGNADYDYGTGYRDNAFKHFFRKSGVGDGAKNGSFEVIMRHTGGEIDQDSSVLPWSKTTNYKMRIEWESGGRLKMYRDGAAIGVDEAITGSYAPAGHSVRLGCSPRRDGRRVRDRRQVQLPEGLGPVRWKCSQRSHGALAGKRLDNQQD